jgi:hypothetical protein
MNTDSSLSGCVAAVSSLLAFLYWHLSLRVLHVRRGGVAAVEGVGCRLEGTPSVVRVLSQKCPASLAHCYLTRITPFHIFTPCLLTVIFKIVFLIQTFLLNLYKNLPF